jgi:histidinol-phosphate/aromatic aminotransferase/cobyric acid decarboxylase-like protein
MLWDMDGDILRLNKQREDMEAEIQRLKKQHEDFLLAREKERQIFLSTGLKAFTEVVRLQERIKEGEELMRQALKSDREQQELIRELTEALGGPMREADAYTPVREDLLRRGREAAK